MKGVTKDFVFPVLPFGLSSAPFVFTKVVRPLVKHLRLHAVKIACFLKNGLGVAYEYKEGLTSCNFVKTTLVNSRFAVNVAKPFWISCQRILG